MYFSPKNLIPGDERAPQALKCVLPVVESFSNKEMRTFGRICAHQSTSDTINIALRRKTNPASVNYSAVVVLATNRIYGAFPLRVMVHFRYEDLWCISVVEYHG